MSHDVTLVTASSEDEANAIAERLVADRIAACVNIIPGVTSVYRWQGKVERDQEQLLLIKTTPDAYGDLERLVLETHPYDVPEVIAVRVDEGSLRYLDWIAGSVG